MSNKKAREARREQGAAAGTDPARAARQAKIDAARKSSAGRGVNHVLVAAVASVLAIFLVVGGAIFLDQKRKRDAGVGTAFPAASAGMGQGYYANEDVELVENAPTLDLYEDFRCSACQAFEAQFGETISTLASEGKIKLMYHSKTLIDKNTGTDESLDISNATFCAADAGQYQEFHDGVYATPPANEGGWSDAAKRDLAEQAGITGDKLEKWQSCVDDGVYDAYVQSVEEASVEAGATSTPTVRLNGEDVSDEARSSPEALIAAVTAATK